MGNGGAGAISMLMLSWVAIRIRCDHPIDAEITWAGGWSVVTLLREYATCALPD